MPRRAKPGSTCFGLSRSQDVAYIANRIVNDDPNNWNVYNRLAYTHAFGGLIVKWNCRYSSNGYDQWCYFQINNDGTVTLGANPVDGPDDKTVTVVPKPGLLAHIQKG